MDAITQRVSSSRSSTLFSRDLVHKHYWLLFTILFLTLYVSVSHAQNSLAEEPYNSGWSVQIDNDLLARGSRDQNYTGGFMITHSGRRAEEYRFSPAPIRGWIDRINGIDMLIGDRQHHKLHAFEWGAALFTPTDIASRDINTQDRPYASLFFVSSTQQRIIPSEKLSIKTGVTLGILGLNLADTIQSNIHSAIGSDKPRGWNNQISDGGELTIKYSAVFQRAAYQKSYQNGLAQELNWTGKADLGFSTGLGVGVNWRFGQINTPWWSFNPHQSDYVNLGANIAPAVKNNARVKERYFYAGANLSYNFYDAFVQGQFRSSAFTVDRSDIVPARAEAWVGVSYELEKRLRIDTFIRARTRTLDLRDSTRLMWGGVVLSRSY